MKRHEVGRAIYSNLSKAGYGDEKSHGSATRTMMGAAQFAVDKHHKTKKKGAKGGDKDRDDRPLSDSDRKHDKKTEGNRQVAGKIVDAIRGISAHHSDPADVGSSEIIRSTAKGHAGYGEW